jgi:hypothetical protein
MNNTLSSSNLRRSSKVLSTVIRREPLTSLTPPALTFMGGNSQIPEHTSKAEEMRTRRRSVSPRRRTESPAR